MNLKLGPINYSRRNRKKKENYGNPLSENSVWKMIHPIVVYPCVRVAQKNCFFGKLLCATLTEKMGRKSGN